MPNRIIKESIHTSDGVNAMTDFQFRLWVSLITYVDDFGRGDARPAIIKGQCFPLRPKLTTKDIETGLLALANLGCIRLYEAEGKPYFYFPRWEDHQRIRSKISKYPAPNTDLLTHDNNSLTYDSDSPQNAPVIQSNPIQNPNTNTKGNTRTRETPPTLEEVETYCKERNSPVDPVKFWEYFNAGGWKDAKGQPVRSWKQKLLTWEKYDKPATVNTSYPSEPAKTPEEDDKAARDLLEKLKGA